MSQARDIRRRLYGGERVCGTMAFEFFTPGLIPLLHGAGCDWVILDTEHSGVGIETIKQQIAYARGLDVAVWVRVPEIRYGAIAPMLDADAQGIMCRCSRPSRRRRSWWPRRATGPRARAAAPSASPTTATGWGMPLR